MNMKKLTSLALVLVMVMALLAGCACNHEWEDADCKNPKTCKLCGETEGEKSSEHNWEDATTEAPKTCKTCGKTEGEKINVDERFKTSACKDLFGTWEAKQEMDAADMDLEGVDGKVSMTVIMTFSNDGKMTTSMELDTADLIALMEEAMYAQFTAMGMSKEEADAAAQENMGMSIKEYVESFVESLVESMTMDVNMVYYVEDGKIYAAEGWDKEFEGEEFTLENGKLVMSDDEMTLEFTKK